MKKPCHRPHRRRMNDSQPGLAKFRGPDDPPRLVFVCAMWMTGFGAPSCSTYSTNRCGSPLMQTIARANRVARQARRCHRAQRFRSLEKALAVGAREGAVGQAGAGRGAAGGHAAPPSAPARVNLGHRSAPSADRAAGGSGERHQHADRPAPRLATSGGQRSTVPSSPTRPPSSPQGSRYQGACRHRAKLSPPDISEIMGQITGLLDESIMVAIRSGSPTIDLSRSSRPRAARSRSTRTPTRSAQVAIREAGECGEPNPG
jgi:type I restriction enzyme R subunit